jgi:glyoxylase-like metal-dependent hydrolase (beta-lactamase superfamily II)
MTSVVNVGYRSTNYYALSCNNGKLLVDCGWPRTLPQFTAELRRKGIAPAEIMYILATHFHPDHAGLVEEFKKLGAKLILMESQAKALRPEVSQSGSKMPAFIAVSATSNVILKFAESRQFLSSLGLAGEIIPTPGHSDDSVTLILDDGSAFTGDLPPRFAVADEDTVSKASWREIQRHKVTRIFPAHGG